MRTVEEIVARVKERQPNDFLGFEIGDYIIRLPFEAAKPWIKDDVKPEEWSPESLDHELILARMQDYMSFAWEKANGGRGISASRSMAHYTAWAWLIGDDFGDLLDYQFYGKDNLVRICNHYGWDSSQWDDGVRSNG